MFVQFLCCLFCLYLSNQLHNLCKVFTKFKHKVKKKEKHKQKNPKNQNFWLQTHFAWSHLVWTILIWWGRKKPPQELILTFILSQNHRFNSYSNRITFFQQRINCNMNDCQRRSSYRENIEFEFYVFSALSCLFVFCYFVLVFFTLLEFFSIEPNEVSLLVLGLGKIPEYPMMYWFG